MIKVKIIVTDEADGSLENEIEFDAANIVHREGGVTVIHRDVDEGMRAARTLVPRCARGRVDRGDRRHARGAGSDHGKQSLDDEGTHVG